MVRNLVTIDWAGSGTQCAQGCGTTVHVMRTDLSVPYRRHCGACTQYPLLQTLDTSVPTTTSAHLENFGIKSPQVSTHLL